MGDESLDVLYAKDVSIGGLAVIVPHRFEGTRLEDEVKLVVKLPGRSAFMATGTVRHVNPDGELFGVEFRKLADADRVKVAQYVEELVRAGRSV